MNDTNDLGPVEHRNPIRELGFAQIEHIIGLDTNLSDGAYRTLSILHYFWQQKRGAYPSLETLAELRGKDIGTISRHLAELTEKKIISRSRRFGTSSITYLEDLPQEYQDAARAILQKRHERKNERSNMAKMQDQSLQKCDVEPRKNAVQRITSEEEQVEEEPTNIIPPFTEKEIDSEKPNLKSEQEAARLKKQGIEGEEFSAIFCDVDDAMGGMRPSQCERVKDLLEEFPYFEAHAHAYEQTKAHAEFFHLTYYEECLKRYVAAHPEVKQNGKNRGSETKAAGNRTASGGRQPPRRGAKAKPGVGSNTPQRGYPQNQSG